MVTWSQLLAVPAGLSIEVFPFPLRHVAGVVEDGELASLAFAAFDEGEKPRDLVQRLKIPPGTALALWKQFVELRDTGGGAGPTTAERIAALEKRIGEVASAVEQYGTGCNMLAEDILTMQRQLAEIRAALERFASWQQSLPPPPKDSFQCRNCGAVGLVETPVICTHCGTHETWGFRPQVQR